MHRFEVQKVIDGSADRVWALLDNFADTYVYHPIVERSTSVNGQTAGRGAERQCEMYGGGAVKERVTEHDASARRYTVEVFDFGPMPLTQMTVEIAVEPAGADRSRVTYAGTFTPRFGPAGWLMAKVMMKRQFERMMGSLIDGVEAHLRTGRLVERGGALGPAVAAA